MGKAKRLLSPHLYYTVNYTTLFSGNGKLLAQSVLNCIIIKALMKTAHYVLEQTRHTGTEFQIVCLKAWV